MRHSEEKVAEALKVITEYKEDILKLYVTEYTCACCRANKIERLYPNHIPFLKQEQDSWKNGTVSLLTPGFGSKHDMEGYYIGICDECISTLKEKGLIKNKELINPQIRIINSIF